MFRHHQEIDSTGRVRSIQSLDLPVECGPSRREAAEAGRQYWTFLRRIGLGLLRVRPRPDGGVDVGIPGLLLLGFGAPTIVEHEGGFAARYGIETGAVVQRQGRGQGYLQVGLGAHRLSLAVEGYYAALVGPRRHPLWVAFYLLTQSTLHLVIARSFLAILRRWLPSATVEG